MLKKAIKPQAICIVCLLLLFASCSTLRSTSGGQKSSLPDTSRVPSLEEHELTEVVVREVMLDPESMHPVVILQDLSGNIALPIWIGSNEAVAIATPLEQVSFRRPMTHDLLYTILGEVHVTVVKVVVSNLRENTYYAYLYLRHRRKTYAIDARPSDAIALAVRAEAPIYVSTELLNSMGIKRGVQQL
jgi:bifunctional DNase/RNase